MVFLDLDTYYKYPEYHGLLFMLYILIGQHDHLVCIGVKTVQRIGSVGHTLHSVLPRTHRWVPLSSFRWIFHLAHLAVNNVQVNVSKIPSKEFCSEPPVWRSGRMVDVVVLGSVGLVVGSVGLVVGSGSSSTPSITFWMQVGVSKPGISSSPWKNEKWDENYLWKNCHILPS